MVQIGTRSDILTISRRYMADRQHTVKQINGKFATDTIWENSMSLRVNVAIQMYIHKCGLNASYPTPRVNRLNYFVSDYKAPEHLTYDGLSMQVGRNTHFQKSVGK